MATSPYSNALGIRADGDHPTRLVITPGPATYGRPGFLHGGAIASLLEAAAYAAIAHGLENEDGSGATFKPITLTIDYVRGGHVVDTFAEGRVTRLGARIANVVAEAWQTDRDRPIASARVTLRIRRS